MNKGELAALVLSYFSGNKGSLEEILDWNGDSGSERFFVNTAKRTAKTYQLYKLGRVDRRDFLMTLRDFMLVFDVTIPSSVVTIEEDDDFGIHYDKGTNSYWAELNPSKTVGQLPDRFLRDVYGGKAGDKKSTNQDADLVTGPFIRKLTGYRSFKTIQQKLAVYGALKAPDGYTTLISLPTGGGKSLITQTLAFQKSGLTIVVVPTVSLAIDQCRTARLAIKEKSVQQTIDYYTSGKDASQLAGMIRSRKLRLLFISPEALIRNRNFAEAVTRQASYIDNIVIDEAHLAVEWGDLFRVDFQSLRPWREQLMKSNKAIRTYLLSATLSQNVVATLKRLFSQEDKWLAIRCDSLRKEPRFALVSTQGEAEHDYAVLKLIKVLPHPMIVYTRSPESAERLGELLKKKGISQFRVFTGKTTGEKRKEIIDGWAKDEFPLVIATNAFGVGVDKGDVRTVLNIEAPRNADGYYQELGRGGRDGCACLSVVALDFKAYVRSSDYKGLLPDKAAARWNTMFLENAISDGADYIIDTSLVPDYTEIENPEFSFNPYINNAHNMWNIYVIFLLQRYGLLDVKEICYENGSYEVRIAINDDVLRNNDEKLLKVFEKIREQDKEKSDHEKDILMKMFKDTKNGKLRCWSSLFTKIYPLTDSYCAGCPEHENPEFDVEDTLLKQSISKPETQIAPLQQAQFGNALEMIVQGSWEQNIKWLSEMKPSVLVTGEGSRFTELLLESDYSQPLLIIPFGLFRKLFKEKDYYFLSGVTAVALSDNELQANQELETIKRTYSSQVMRTHAIRVAFMTASDFYVRDVQKNLSEIIDGPMIRL